MPKQTVSCWFCDREVSLNMTHKFPNGARVCLTHKCDECGDFVRSDDAVCLITEDEKVVHMCAKHRGKIIELRDFGGYNVKGYNEALAHLNSRL